MGVLQLQPLSTSLLLKFDNTSVKRFHFVFQLHESRSRFSKHIISVPIKRSFRNICGVRESEERFTYSQTPVDVLKENPLYLKKCLDSTYSGLKSTRQVSLYLSDLQMNWTSSFLFVINLRSFCTCSSLGLSELLVFGEMPVILVLSKLPGSQRARSGSHAAVAVDRGTVCAR